MSGCWVFTCSTSTTCTMLRSEMAATSACCSDILYMSVLYVEVFPDLNVASYTSECEPFFDMLFEGCFANGHSGIQGTKLIV